MVAAAIPTIAPANGVGTVEPLVGLSVAPFAYESPFATTFTPFATGADAFLRVTDAFAAASPSAGIALHLEHAGSAAPSGPARRTCAIGPSSSPHTFTVRRFHPGLTVMAAARSIRVERAVRGIGEHLLRVPERAERAGRANPQGRLALAPRVALVLSFGLRATNVVT